MSGRGPGPSDRAAGDRDPTDPGGTDLDAGDLVWTDLDPTLGREQAGRRPALIVSPQAFHRASGFVIACPITSRIRPFGTSVLLPPGLPITGEILTSHLRSLDARARPLRPIGATVPPETRAEVRTKLALLLGIEG